MNSSCPLEENLRFQLVVDFGPSDSHLVLKALIIFLQVLKRTETRTLFQCITKWKPSELLSLGGGW